MRWRDLRGMSWGVMQAAQCTSALGRGETWAWDLGSYNFSAKDEATLVEFYREHDCFYNKGSVNFSNSQCKTRLMRDMAAK